MNIKLFGAFFVIVGCGGWGFLIAAQYMQKIRLLRNLIGAISYMECELQYRSTALPALCAMTGEQTVGKIRQLFCTLSQELEMQVAPNAEVCMEHALERCGDIPRQIQKICRTLGNTLGKFDLQGQLRGLEAVRLDCSQILTQLQKNHEARTRSYQTLGICAGAAMVILFI